MINSNMRCIEIRLILGSIRTLVPINSNMRCIEMTEPYRCRTCSEPINSNMRCIEIPGCPLGILLLHTDKQ